MAIVDLAVKPRMAMLTRIYNRVEFRTLTLNRRFHQRAGSRFGLDLSWRVWGADVQRLNAVLNALNNPADTLRVDVAAMGVFKVGASTVQNNAGVSISAVLQAGATSGVLTFANVSGSPASGKLAAGEMLSINGQLVAATADASHGETLRWWPALRKGNAVARVYPVAYPGGSLAVTGEFVLADQEQIEQVMRNGGAGRHFMEASVPLIEV